MPEGNLESRKIRVSRFNFQVEVDVNLCYCSTQNCNQVGNFVIQNTKYKIPNVKKNIFKLAEKQIYLILVICEQKSTPACKLLLYLVENIRLIFLKIFAMNDT